MPKYKKGEKSKEEQLKHQDKLEQTNWFFEESQKIAQVGSYDYNIKNDHWTSTNTLNGIFGIDCTYKKDFAGWLQIVDISHRQMMMDYFANDVLGKKMPFDKEYIIQKVSTGEKLWVYGRGTVFYDEEGNPINMIGTIQDINERKKAAEYAKEMERLLFEEKERLRITLQSIADGIITTDTNERIISLNTAAENITGWKTEEAYKKNFEEIFDITNEYTGEKAKNPIKDVLEHNRTCVLENHTILKAKDGTAHFIADSAAPIKNSDGVTTGVVIVFRDVTEKKKYMDEVKFLSYHDSLTGLYNRAFLKKELEKIVENHSLPVSVIMGDVNGLKLINDVYGHDMGDKLLKSTAQILKACCPQESIVSRWGGDEFTILLPKTTGKQANRIIDNIKNACLKSSFETTILSISLGTATKSDGSKHIKDILCEAEDMMYTNKLVEGKSFRSTIIASLQKTLYERSGETEEHAVRMMELANLIGNKIALSHYEMNEMKLLTLLHDIGKIGIADCILNKVDKLSNEEWCEMKKHPEIGYRIAQATPELSHISELILCHHEHWDGKGYPQGLKKENIPKLSRILAIIDAYDVMTNGRPYKAAIKKEAAIVELIKCAGTQFDPVLVKEFVDLIQ